VRNKTLLLDGNWLTLKLKRQSQTIEAHWVEGTPPPRDWNRTVISIWFKCSASASSCHIPPVYQVSENRLSSCWETDKYRQTDWL